VRAGQSWRGDWFNRRADGSTYPVRGIVTPVKDDAGRLACYVAALEDVRANRSASRRSLREARDRAEAGDKAKGQNPRDDGAAKCARRSTASWASPACCSTPRSPPSNATTRTPSG